MLAHPRATRPRLAHRPREHALIATALACLSGAIATPAEARRKRPSVATLALFPLLPGDAAAGELPAQLDALLADAVRASRSDALLGAELSRRLREPARQAVESCKSELACLMRLAKKVRTEQLLYGSLRKSDGKTRLLLHLVDTSRATQLDKSIEIAMPPEAASLSAAVGELMGGEAPPEPAAQEAPTASTSDELELTPLPGITPAPAGAPDQAAPREPTKQSDADTRPLAALTPPGSEVAQVPAHSRWLLYAGISASTLGALSLGGGALFGLKSESNYSEAVQPTTSQLDAGRLGQSGDRAVERANLLFVVGSALLTSGGVAVAIDMISGSEAR